MTTRRSFIRRCAVAVGAALLPVAWVPQRQIQVETVRLDVVGIKARKMGFSQVTANYWRAICDDRIKDVLIKDDEGNFQWLT